jgi:hypothetical protein
MNAPKWPANEHIHDFHECLARSHAAHTLPIWEACYRQFFSSFLDMHYHDKDSDLQRLGVDRSVVLSHGKYVFVDEKVRFPNAKTGRVYTDIALEEWSDEERKIPGWVVKRLMCDYIAYAILAIGKCWLLPTLQLQEAWLKHSKSWKSKGILKPIRSKNLGYTTLSWGIEEKILFPAIGGCLRATFQPIELQQ